MPCEMLIRVPSWGLKLLKTHEIHYESCLTAHLVESCQVYPNRASTKDENNDSCTRNHFVILSHVAVQSLEKCSRVTQVCDTLITKIMKNEGARTLQNIKQKHVGYQPHLLRGATAEGKTN